MKHLPPTRKSLPVLSPNLSLFPVSISLHHGPSMLFQQCHHSLHLCYTHIKSVLLAAASWFHFQPEKSIQGSTCPLGSLAPQLLPVGRQDCLTGGTVSRETHTRFTPRITSRQTALLCPPAGLSALTRSNSMIFSLMSLRQKQNYLQATCPKSWLPVPCNIIAMIDLQR